MMVPVLKCSCFMLTGRALCCITGCMSIKPAGPCNSMRHQAGEYMCWAPAWGAASARPQAC